MSDSPGDVRIRRFEPADAPAVSDLIAETMRSSNSRDYSRNALEPLIAYFSTERLCRLAQERHVIVATVDHTIIATAALEGDRLVTFFVHPRHQGRGIGTRLLSTLEHIARESEIATLYVEASVTGARFYERHGYRRAGEPFEGTAGPQIPMSKPVGRDPRPPS